MSVRRTGWTVTRQQSTFLPDDGSVVYRHHLRGAPPDRPGGLGLAELRALVRAMDRRGEIDWTAPTYSAEPVFEAVPEFTDVPLPGMSGYITNNGISGISDISDIGSISGISGISDIGGNIGGALK